MSQTVSIEGVLRAGAALCPSNGQAADQCTRALALNGSCPGQGVQYGGCIVATPRANTAGAVGAEFERIECLEELATTELLYINTNSTTFAFRIGAAPATALGVGGTFPTGFSGGEVLTWVVDGTTVTTTFDAADQTAEQCAARINAAAAFTGLTTPRVTATTGQLEFTGEATGRDGSNVFSGTAAATLGLDNPTLTPSAGEDVFVSGLWVHQFPRGAGPSRIDVSGVGSFDIVAAGTVPTA